MVICDWFFVISFFRSTGVSPVMAWARCPCYGGRREAQGNVPFSCIIKPDCDGHVNQFRVKPAEAKLEDAPLVPGMTIHHIMEMAGFESIDVLKVDVEGAEVEIFKGNTDWLNRVGWLVIEFHDGSRKESNFDTLLSERGWKILDESSHTVVAGRG